MKKPYFGIACIVVLILAVVFIVLGKYHSVPPEQLQSLPFASDAQDSTATGTDQTDQSAAAPTIIPASIPAATPAPSGSAISVVDPPAHSPIASPLAISGQAPGEWFSQGAFPVQLLNANGDIIAQGSVTAQGDPAASGPIAFQGTLTFDPQPSGGVGELILDNGNPSTAADDDKSFQMLVTFK